MTTKAVFSLHLCVLCALCVEGIAEIKTGASLFLLYSGFNYRSPKLITEAALALDEKRFS